MWKNLIEADELQQEIAIPGNLIRVVDCRYDLANPAAGRERFEKGHIPGAFYADLNSDLSGAVTPRSGRHPLPAPEKLECLFSSWSLEPDTWVIAYDDSDHSGAARLWWLLRFAGHERVGVLHGGFAAWVRSGFPLETGGIPFIGKETSKFAFRPQNHLLIEATEVHSARLLVDSRDPARYRGEVEPVDPVAGHIPGAKNLFYKETLGADGKFLPEAVLAERFQSVLGAVPASESVFYCGSGVTACVNLLAAQRAGLKIPRLYAGSWSEWCKDPSREIAHGAG